MLPDGKPVKTHAGGLAWREDWLYVADTNKGLRLFDLRRFSGRTLPQAGWYRPESKDLRFSYASVDDAAGALLVGEYRDKARGRAAGALAVRARRAARAGGGERGVGDRPPEPAGRGRPRRADADGAQPRVAARGHAHALAVRGERGRSSCGRSAARTWRSSTARSSRSPSTPTWSRPLARRRTVFRAARSPSARPR